MNVLITGGAGFIGSALVRCLLNDERLTVCVLDSLTYAGSLDNLAEISSNLRYSFVEADICNGQRVAELFGSFRPDWVFHLAAESHVDNSISAPGVFMQTNIIGTYNLLNAALDHYRGLDADAADRFRFVHVSTDEVFGDLGESENGQPFSEGSNYLPNSPYSASKAASDHLVRAWHKTYGLPVIITNCSNNYGPRQFREKLIPVILSKALAHEPIPIYGEGTQVRDWLHVDDHAKALYAVAQKAAPGSRYNIGGNCPMANIELTRMILSQLAAVARRHGLADFDYERLITYVPDRLGHDTVYLIDSTRIANELGWNASISLEEGIEQTVKWYFHSLRGAEKRLAYV